MTLKIIVTVKQVPDTQNITGDAMSPNGTVNRNALPAIFNPEDLNALEEALKITPKDIMAELGGLPAVKVHCSVLADQAFEKTIENYRGGK